MMKPVNFAKISGILADGRVMVCWRLSLLERLLVLLTGRFEVLIHPADCLSFAVDLDIQSVSNSAVSHRVH